MKSLKRIATVVGVLVLIAAGFVLGWRIDMLELDDAARAANAPGQFVALSDGKAHYQWHGPEDGAVTVLVHGFSTPSFVWLGILQPLTEAGLRVLTYDHFGRGWSDRPKVANDADLFDRQLVELLASQDVGEPFNLVGYSMGGAISVNFLARHPGRAKRLALISPVGFPDPRGTLSKLIALTNLTGPKPAQTALPDIFDRYIQQASYKGYLRSLISTSRHFPLTDTQTSYAAVGAQSLPVAAIWGERDTVAPYANAELLARAIPRAEFTTIEGGPHSITYTEADKVAAALIPFLTAPLK